MPTRDQSRESKLRRRAALHGLDISSLWALERFLHLPRTSLDDIEKWLDARDLRERASKPSAKDEALH